MFELNATDREGLPDASGVDGGTSGPPRAVLLTLVPNSSIQFIDYAMTEAAVARTRRRFFEEVVDGDEPSLHVATSSDGVLYHPVTNVPCDPATAYTLSGADGLAPFLDTWLPLPFMRVSEGDGEVGPVLDEGPSNWTRVHISRDNSESGSPVYRVVLAIDTAVDLGAAPALRAYAGPTVDDLKAGAAFRFSDDVADIAWFVSEAWVDDWIKAAFDRCRVARLAAAIGPGALEHLAGYLTVLAVLKEACDVPALRFMEPNAVGAYAETVPVDLALDLGTRRTGVLLAEQPIARHKSGDGDDGLTRGMWPLSLRDLGEPWRNVEGAWSSRLTFSRASFGNEALSRWSGRTQAFHWPSPLRVGSEAERLARLPETGEAVIGVSSPMHYIWDERPSRNLWRFAGGGESGTRRTPVVSGSILAHLTESGELIESRGGQGATTKPRFSRSSLLGLVVAEILLHALGDINAPEARERRGRPQSPRRLARILVTPPAAMLDGEIAVLRRRVEAGMRLVWQAMGWNVEGHPLAPPLPSVVIVADAGISKQVAYLEHEIAYKFRGKSEPLLAIAGKSRAGFAASRVLRIATLDIGGATSGLSVATWEPAAGNALAASRQLVEGFETGCDSVVKALAERFVVGSLCRRLVECKHSDPRKLLQTILTSDEPSRPAWVGDLGRRLVSDLLAPAATALLHLYAHSEADAGDVPTDLSIATLLASVGADAKIVADRLDVVAADDGADGFAPLEVTVPFLMRELGAVARQVLRPMLDNTVRVLAALDCDIVLVSGGGAGLPVVREVLLAGLPVRPDRVIAIDEPGMRAWFPRQAAGDAKLLAAAGALLQGRGAFGAGGPAIVLRPLERQAAQGFIGRLGADGRIAADDVLFELMGADLAGASGLRGASREHSAGRVRTTTVGLPAAIGTRAPSLASWISRPAWVIERDPGSTGRGPKLPLKVTLELAPPERGKPAELKLVSAIDGDGGRLDPSEIVLRMKTRSFAYGYWLDTGLLAVGDTGAGR